MYIVDDGIRLNAKLEMPEEYMEGERCPLVIVIHGFTGHMEEPHILAAAKVLREAGCATLRVEMYGHGKSDGEFRNHTLFKWMTNAMTVIDYARGLDFVTDLYLCGHSQGGLLVMLAGGMKSDVIRGIIPLSPACMIPEQARRGELLGITFDPNRIPEEVGIWDDGKLGGNYIRAAQMIHVEDAVRKFGGPVLIVHGDADETVPFEVGRAAAEAYEDAEFVAVPGDTHCFDYHVEQMAEAVKRWMIRRLQ